MKTKNLWIGCFILVFIIFSSTIFSAATSDSTVVISGQIFTADGKAPILAHAQLTEISENFHNPMQSIKANPDGKFEISIKEPGLYSLWISAVDHQTTKIPIVITKEDKKIDLKVTLHHPNYAVTFNEIKIVGSWNNFNFRKAETMQPAENGKFVYHGNSKSDTIAYQLSGIVDGQFLNGTTSNDYEYDKNGGYRSILNVKPGPIEIVFDPSRLDRSKDTSIPKIVFDKRHSYLEKIFNISYQSDQKIKEYQKAYMSYSKEGKDISEFSFDCRDLKTMLEKNLNNEKELSVEQFSAIYLVQLLSLSKKPLNSELGSKILKIVSPSSSFWGIEPNTAIMISFSLEKEYPSLLKEFSELNPNRKVRAKALIGIASNAKISGDSQKVNEIYAELVKNYGDIKEIQYELAKLNPNKRIEKGKPVPDFKVKLIGSGETVSQKSLLGNYYLLDFWASWCEGCRNEMPFLHNAYEKFHNKGFEILSLSLDDKPEDVDEFRKDKWKMPWLNSLVDGGFDSKLMQDFEAKGLPKLILVGPDGNIIASDLDVQGAMLEKTLSKYLGDK
jgi:thiol-disulfide isomerase/thioredoxin